MSELTRIEGEQENEAIKISRANEPVMLAINNLSYLYCSLGRQRGVEDPDIRRVLGRVHASSPLPGRVGGRGGD
jgi:hypothetical protein